MRLHAISLRNIRSYLSATVPFPDGSVLLSGDIGAGKSTILLATEFALFGIKRGDLSGESLLRNGKKDGWVELAFSVGERRHVIRRTLRRTKDGVKQEPGFLIIDGAKREGTPVELRAWMWEILGYPPEVMEKGKDLIYRYTVYTPQEEMKRILTDREDERLDILRRVFQIDKYKRIRENTQVVLHRLREELSHSEGRARELPLKREELASLDEQLRQVGERVLQYQDIHATLERSLRQKEEEAQMLQEEGKRLLEAKTAYERLGAELRSIMAQRKNATEEIARLERMTASMPPAPPPVSTEEIRALQATLPEAAERLDGVQRDLATAASKERIAAGIISSIQKLQECPTCLQPVSDHYKQGVVSRQQECIAHEHAESEKLRALQQSLKTAKERIEADIDRMRSAQHAHQVFLVKKQEQERLANMLLEKQALAEKLKQRLGEINVEQQVFSKKLTALAGLEAKTSEVQDAISHLRRQEREIAVKIGAELRDRDHAVGRIERLRQDITVLESVQREAGRLKSLTGWLSEEFPQIIASIERHVMAAIHQEFSQFFSEWFGMLVEDEALAARLDERFTPMVVQNGFETRLEDLSGGEKTACALAYRLALNKVINHLLDTIQTKGVLFLDEPTDGFSSEQLDNVREVLNSLGLAQVIIVSHEQKIESFVQHVIRIRKEEHVSSAG